MEPTVEPTSPRIRKIIHVDMDAFYTSVEQRDFPELKGKPVVVGGDPHGRGVIAAASYEARKFGIRSAMSSRTAYELCPKAVFLKPRFEQYRAASAAIMEIFRTYTDLVEPLSLDEAYLDVTENKFGIPFARDIAKQIKTEILNKTGLTASAGVAANKFLAKIASDFQKPNGLTVIPPERVEQFLENLPVRKFPGIGPVTEEKMVTMGIFTARHLRNKSLEELSRIFGKSGQWYYKICRGEDNRPVIAEWERKSLGAEETFDSDLNDVDRLLEKLAQIATRVSTRLEKRELSGRTLTLKVTFSDFQKITRGKTRFAPYLADKEIFAEAKELLLQTDIVSGRPVRLLGIQVSNFEGEKDQELQDREKQFIGPVQLSFPFSYQQLTS